MSKKNKKRSQEIPQVGNALEVPNYVIPTTDLEYREINDQVQPRNTDCRTEDCRGAENCGEGHFAPGSMLPKVKAAISFAETGGEAIIASLENAGKAVRGESGTVVHK